MPSSDGYAMRDNVILTALVNSGASSTFVLHDESGHGYEEAKSKMKAMGLYTAELYDGWDLKFRVFVSKDKDAADRVAKINGECWDNFNKPDVLSSLLLEVYKLVQPECCHSRVSEDAMLKINTKRRYALQLIGFSRQYNSSFIDEVEAEIHLNKEVKEKMYENGKGKNRGEIYESNEKVVSANRLNALKSLSMEVFKSFYGRRLAGEMVPCTPDCESMFTLHTNPRFDAMSRFGYNIKEVSVGVGSSPRTSSTTTTGGRRTRLPMTFWRSYRA